MKIQSVFCSLLTLAILHAQEKPDPWSPAKTEPPGGVQDNIPKNISICFETFSLPLLTAAKLYRDQPTDSELYTRLIAAVEKETVRQETLAVVRCRSSQNGIIESISEQIYPTEYESAELPNAVAVSLSPPPAKEDGGPPSVTEKTKTAAELTTFNGLRTSATPTAFQTRNTGMTLEIEPTLSENEKLVDLRLVVEFITYVGRSAWGQDVSTAELPTFEAQRINTASTLHIDRPFMLGTISRPPVSNVDPDSANRVWFAFVTATIAKP